MCPALNASKIKYHSSEMKSEIKLCASSFSVVTLPVFFCLIKDIFCVHSVIQFSF
jgi:hypothetical protein